MTFTFIIMFQCKYYEIGQCYSQQFSFLGIGKRSRGGEPKSLSKNPFLLDEGVVDLLVLTLNAHVLGGWLISLVRQKYLTSIFCYA